MLRLKGAVEYLDGRVVEFECGTAAVAAWERYAIRNKLPLGEGAPAILSSMVTAHHALGIEEGFDGWAETVLGVDLEAVGEVPPTPPAASLDKPSS